MESVIYRKYERQIVYLRKRGDELLQRIKKKEIKMNQRKQQNLQPTLRSLKTLNKMIEKLLRMSAFINSSLYFQIVIKEPLTINNNQTLFYQMTNDYYQHILRRFVLIIRHRAQLKYQKLLLKKVIRKVNF